LQFDETGKAKLAIPRDRFGEFDRALATFGPEAPLRASRSISIRSAADFAARRLLGAGAVMLYSFNDRQGVETQIDSLRRLRRVACG
jgi:hypothetical protein